MAECYLTGGPHKIKCLSYVKFQYLEASEFMMDTTAVEDQAREDIGYDPLDSSDLACPFPHYKRLREQCPVVYSDRLRAYIVSDTGDIRAALKAPELFSNVGTVDLGFGDVSVLVTADGDKHRKQRSIVNSAFTARRVAEMEPYIQQLTDELIDGFEKDGECELVSQFALRIPANVISKMMGLPIEDFDRLKGWAEAGLRASADPDQHLEAAMVAALELADYLAGAAEERLSRAEPGDDLLSALVHAEVDGEKLANDELFLICWQLFTAGHETTTSLISTAVHLLDRHPEQRGMLLSDFGLIEQAVEEVLRFEGPAQAMPRRVTEESQLHGVTIPKDGKITVMYGAANHDPAQWDNPDKFDITRPLRDTKRKTLAFGSGPHTCLGAGLARLQGRIALTRLYERLPNIRVDTTKESERSVTHFTRGWKRLWTIWD